MKKKKKKNNTKKLINNIFNSYKTIIYISFLINIILLLVCYNITTSNKIYSFSGEDEYLKVKDGLLVFNKDINILNGNCLKYVNKEDYEVKSYKIGYYFMDGSKLVEIVSNSMELENSINISEIINNFTSFNITEKDGNATYFTSNKKKLIDNGLYIIIDAKTSKGETVYTKLKLNVSKVSKF